MKGQLTRIQKESGHVWVIRRVVNDLVEPFIGDCSNCLNGLGFQLDSVFSEEVVKLCDNGQEEQINVGTCSMLGLPTLNGFCKRP